MKTVIRRRRLGRTGLYITELGYGAMNLRMLRSYDEACAIVNGVLDNGINFIDTARAYKGEIAPGILLESEKVVGDVVRQRSDLTEPVVIITKGHAYTIPDLEKDLAASLRTLGVSGKGDLRIGGNAIRLVYLVHGISDERWATVQSSGVLRRLQELKEEGVVNHLGFSSHYPFPKVIKEAVDTGVFDVVELPYNVFNRSLGEDGAIDLLKYIHDRDIGLINMKAFDGNGMVPVYKVIRDLITIDYETMLRFCLSNPYITSVDAGARYLPELELDVRTAADARRYSAAELADIKAEAGKIAGHMKGICRECMHCMEKFECPNQIDFPHILSVYSRFTVLDKLGKDTSAYSAQYRAFEKNALDCTECGACKPWCEYKLDVPRMLRQAHEAAMNQGV